MTRFMDPDEVESYAESLDQQIESTAEYDGQLITDAPGGLTASGDLDLPLRPRADWFGGITAPWYDDMNYTLEDIYFYRSHEAVTIHRELTGIKEDLLSFVVQWRADESAAVFEFNNASDGE